MDHLQFYLVILQQQHLMKLAAVDGVVVDAHMMVVEVVEDTLVVPLPIMVLVETEELPISIQTFV